MKPIPFEIKVEVPRSAIDHFGHVNNAFYLKLIQRVANKHWRRKTPLKIRRKRGWLVLDHYVEYKKPAFEKDLLILKTWIEDSKTAKSIRLTEIYRIENDQSKTLIAKAKTTWCFMNLENFKPIRIREKILKPFFE